MLAGQTAVRRVGVMRGEEERRLVKSVWGLGILLLLKVMVQRLAESKLHLEHQHIWNALLSPRT